MERVDLLDEHVMILYNGKPYPGIVVDIDAEDVKVNCMHRAGQNLFFWPLRDGLCWYMYDDIVTKIPRRTKVTTRHHQVSPDIWTKVTSACD